MDPDSEGWVLLWCDDFDGPALDTDKWEVHTGDGSQYGIPGWGNNERQWYTDLPCNLRVEDSNLVLQAVLDPAAEAVPGRPYTSAKVRTHGRFAVGPSPEHPEVKVEARIKVPAGLGLWPAFWMLPEDGASPYCSGQGQHGGWAASGEVDVMETGNDARMVVGSIHYGGPWPYNTQSSGSYSLGGASLADEFHTFGIEWTTKQIRWYLDGQLYMVQNSGCGTKNGWFSLGSEATSHDDPALPGDAPFGTQRFHLLLNLALGGPGTVFTRDLNHGRPITLEQLSDTLATPQAMLIDWVRVWGRGNYM